MPERTGYDHGVPSWVDLGTSDVEAAKSFYRAIFGWEAEDLPTDDQGMTYTMFTKNGKNVAGMGPILPEQAAAGIPPVWSTYLNVDNVDDAVAKVTDAGGSVEMAATDVMDAGRMAFVTDPTGAAVGLWQAGSHFGAELVNEPGAFVWNELITDDTATAQKFFEEAFGFSAKTMDGINGPYTMYFVEGVTNPVAAMMPKNENMGPIPNYWNTYFAVDDCDDCLETVEASGGTILMQPMDIPDFGRMAVIQDPQGASLTVIQLAREQV